MRREQLEHVIRAAAQIADDDDIVIVGSQAVLGSAPDAPDELLRSVEADLYPRTRPERADVIDGAIGEGSPFHETFGYYAHGVGPETAVAPEGWQERLVPVSGPGTRGATGWCLEPHDLVLAKLVAGRERDVAFARVAVGHDIVEGRELLSRVERLPIPLEHREHVRGLVEAVIGAP